MKPPLSIFLATIILNSASNADFFPPSEEIENAPVSSPIHTSGTVICIQTDNGEPIITLQTPLTANEDAQWGAAIYEPPIETSSTEANSDEKGGKEA